MDLWLWYQNKKAVFTVGWNNITSTKKGLSESFQCERSYVHHLFLIGRASFIMSLFHMVRHSIKSSTWMSWGIWEWQYEEQARSINKENLDATSWQCTCTTPLLIHDFLAKHMMNLVKQPPCSPDLTLTDFFFSQKWNQPLSVIDLEHKRDQRKFSYMSTPNLSYRMH